MKILELAEPGPLRDSGVSAILAGTKTAYGGTSAIRGQAPPPGAFPLVRVPLAGRRRVWCRRRVWDSNPRGRVNALAVFKTAAIGH